MSLETTANYTCAFCGEINTTFIDITTGSYQSYVEDCQICCQPNVLDIEINPETLTIIINSEPES